MFYTLVSRTIITKINSPRDYFYIFLIGSVGYVILHWYLNMDEAEGIMGKIRDYLYYVMVIDAITAYVLMIMYPAKTDKIIEKDNDNDESKEEEQYTPEQRKAILQRMQETRRLQQMRQRAMAEQQGLNNNDQPNVPTKRDSPPNANPTLSKGQGVVPKGHFIEQNPPAVSAVASTDPAKVSEVGKDENKESTDNQGKRPIFVKSEESRESSYTGTDTATQGEKKKEQTKKNSHEANAISKDKNKSSKGDLRIKSKKKDTEAADTDIPKFENQKKEKSSVKPKK